MAKPATGFRLLRLALLAGTALAVVTPAAADSKVGVTSATDGSPLGKPPAEAERVLRIGIDVQANELITTKANDRAHLIFPYCTSLTVGTNAVRKIDKFVYDPDTKKGELSLTATTGVFRVVGGKISKSNAITVNTPSASMCIRGGIVVTDVSNIQTVTKFLFGQRVDI